MTRKKLIYGLYWMMVKIVKLLGLDVGEKRIGYAIGDNLIKIAVPKGVIEVNGNEFDEIRRIVNEEAVELIIVGYPRNQSGETTNQTKFVENFSDKLKTMGLKVVFQDESLTSVIAEQRLTSHNKSYSKSDIDAQASVIILQDYIEMSYAK